MATPVDAGPMPAGNGTVRPDGSVDEREDVKGGRQRVVPETFVLSIMTTAIGAL
jgi:hypothetical protein